MLGDRAVGVVERDRDRLAARRRMHGLAEGRPPIAALEQVAELLFEAFDRDRARGGPTRAEPVVAEDESVRDQTLNGSTRMR